jgi:hypothetical protein
MSWNFPKLRASMIVIVGLAAFLIAPVRADDCTYGYDQFGRLISVSCKNGGGSTTLTITYSYDDAGNRTAQTKTP